MRSFYVVAWLGIFLSISCDAVAASASDIDKMTSYAVIIGRAAGCGVDTTEGMKQVGKWMDRVFPPGSRDQKTYLPVFMDGVRYHAQQQRDGKSPDSCSVTKSAYSRTMWP